MTHYRKLNSKSTFATSVRCPNPKYQHVKAVVSTGMNIRKYLEKIEERERYFKLDKNEDIRRIRLVTFVRLLLQVETSMGEDASEKQTIEEVTNGECNAEVKESFKRPYLLLDVRPVEEYDKERIVTAESYPKRMLAKVMNYETSSMLTYKNVAGHIIVIYDEDEITSKIVVHTLTQRGYDNVYLLSGGLKYVRARFPKGLLIESPAQPSQACSPHDCLTLQDVQQLRLQLNEECGLQSRPHSSASSLSTTGSQSSLLMGTKRPWK